MIPPFPTAHLVAVAIVAAAREMGADPIRVASGERDIVLPAMKWETSRARAYAAMALRSHTSAGPSAVGRLVGAKHVDVYMANLSQAVANGRHRWWDDAIFERVRLALCAAMEPKEPERQAVSDIEGPNAGDWDFEPLPEPNRKPAGAPVAKPAPKVIAPAPRPPRPAASPGKRDLMEELRRAVQNTQAMTPKGET